MKKCLHFIVFIFVLFGFYACASAPFGGYPLINAWVNVVALVAFASLPILVIRNIKRAMVEYVYIP